MNDRGIRTGADQTAVQRKPRNYQAQFTSSATSHKATELTKRRYGGERGNETRDGCASAKIEAAEGGGPKTQSMHKCLIDRMK